VTFPKRRQIQTGRSQRLSVPNLASLRRRIEPETVLLSVMNLGHCQALDSSCSGDPRDNRFWHETILTNRAKS
jgi:uncharacterized protein YcsI (UPF0317 family)